VFGETLIIPSLGFLIRLVMIGVGLRRRVESCLRFAFSNSGHPAVLPLTVTKPRGPIEKCQLQLSLVTQTSLFGKIS